MRRSDRSSGTCGSSRSPDRVQGPSSVPSWDSDSPHHDPARHRRAVHRAIVLIGVPAAVNVTAYVWPLPLMIGLLANEVDPSSVRLARARFFPVEEQEPAGRSELRLTRAGQDLQLQLVDLVLGAVPAGEREIAVPPRAR